MPARGVSLSSETPDQACVGDRSHPDPRGCCRPQGPQPAPADSVHVHSCARGPCAAACVLPPTLHLWSLHGLLKGLLLCWEATRCWGTVAQRHPRKLSGWIPGLLPKFCFLCQGGAQDCSEGIPCCVEQPARDIHATPRPGLQSLVAFCVGCGWAWALHFPAADPQG